MKRRLFVTGAAGALAPFFIHRLLHRSDPPSFHCLLRRADGVDRLRERLAALCPACRRKVKSKRFEFVIGDAVEGFSFAGPIDAVWHFAADLRMEPEVSSEVESNNLAGTRRILEFAGSKAAPLYYLSTAYVCGERSGDVLEDELFCGQTFRNGYESSKARAEDLVRHWQKDHPAVIFRPSIVLGDTRRGIVLSSHGVFRLLQWLLDFKEHMLPRLGFSAEGLRALVLRPPVSFPAPLSETFVNVVDAEYVASLLERIAARPESFGKTFHLVNPNPPSGQELLDYLRRTLGVRDIIPLGPGAAPTPGMGPFEERVGHWLADKLMIYWPYLFGAHPRFDLRRVRETLGEVPAHPRVDDEAWDRMSRYLAKRELSAA